MVTCQSPQDFNVQSMLGIKVTTNDTRQMVSSGPNALLDPLGHLHAGLLFLILVKYCLADVVVLMEGVSLPNAYTKITSTNRLHPSMSILRAPSLFFILKDAVS